MIQKAFKLYNKKYGSRAQIIKAVEELSELQTVLCRYLNLDSGEVRPEIANQIIDEIADVEIMTEQLKMIFKIEKNVLICKDVKIDRMINRINGI